jgi:hypothetical protein
MKRTASALTLIWALLILLVAGVQTVKAQHTADGQGFPLASPISITSPSNSTYSSNLLTLNVTFKLLLSPSCANVTYSIDGKNNATIPLTATLEPVEATRTYENGTTVIVNSTFFVPYTITGWAELPELAEGPHNITVYARYLANNVVGLDEGTVYFSISTNSEQEIPEFPSWIILPLFMAATPSAVIVYRRLTKKASKS